MKRLSTSLVPVFVLAFLTIHSDVQIPEQINAQHHLDRMLAPRDHFDVMRSYPDMVPDQAAMDQAMQTAHQMSFQANRSAGFDQEWRTEGPGNIGARINSLAVPGSNHDTIYAGYAKGGIYRTYDGGSNWTSIFDDQPRLSIGDIAINPLNDQVIYAGTGDRNIGGSFSTGTGIYRSNDGGDTWELKGLQDQYIISEIVIHPTDTAILYAACLGLPSLPSADRGLYKSLDGGNSWTQVLFVGDSAGINDIAMHPTNPDILYVSGWNRVRTNQASVISGNQGRIWKTTDGAANWTMLTNGLPTGPQGRVGLSMFEANPDTLCALFVGTDSQLENIYQTFDGGASWTAMQSNGITTNALGGFGWYFSGVDINPFDYQDVFFHGVQLWRTENNGGSWDMADPPWWTYEVHADKHDMVFLGPQHFLLATDGGLYRTMDSGLNWVKIENNMTNEFYRIAHTHFDEENYYGGMQDNGTSGGNASLADWPRIYGGDGFQVRFHPFASSIFYAETQNGNIVYTDNGGVFFNSLGFPDEANRTNWDTPYMLSPHDPGDLFAASHKVWKMEFAPYGAWSEISEDLTDGNIFGSQFHTISGVDQSPLDDDYLYACTTDGNVWTTTNAGTWWDSVHATLPNRYVTSVKASPDSLGHVFVTHSGYKYNDFFPHVHKSTNNGSSWVNISGDLPPVAVNDIVIFPGHADSVLFVATDAGVYGTIDGGTDWERVGTNMPMIEVFDLDFDTVNHRLIAGTVGKSIMTYPLDSLVSPIPGDTNNNNNPFDLAFATSGQTCINTGNGSINLSVLGGTPPYTYSWSNGSTTEDLSEVLAGTYTVTVTDANLEVSVDEAIVDFDPLYFDPVIGPIAGANQVQSWSQFTYDVLPTTGSVFDWDVTGGTIASSSANTVVVDWNGVGQGLIRVQETNTNGCKASDSLVVDIKAVGIASVKDAELSIYPNPASEYVQIEFDQALDQVEVILRDAQGRQVRQLAFSGSAHSMNLSDLPAGMYQLLLMSGNETSIVRSLMVE